MNQFVSRMWAPVVGALVGGARQGPWRAKTVLLALVISLGGLGLWLRDARPPDRATADAVASDRPRVVAAPKGDWDFHRPVPGYVRVSVSYIGGFMIGWVLRRAIKVAVALAAVAITVVGIGKYAGWDTTRAQATVKERAVWAEQQAAATKDYLTGLMPSASAGGVGAFFGFRRRGKVSAVAKVGSG